MHEFWKIVEERPRGLGKGARVYVSLNRRGEIAMNAEAFKRINRPASVTLMYDAERRRIGVKFPVALDRNFFPVRKYGRGGRNCVIRASRLLKQFGLRVDETLVFNEVQTTELNGEPMLILPLDNARAITRRRPGGDDLREEWRP